MSLIQDFYKEVVSVAWAAGTGKRYVSTKPIPTLGILVVSPSSATLREIVRYNNTGTDGGGDYVMLSERGVGGTTDQTHEVQEPIRMNVTGEHIDDIYAAIAAVVAGGAQDASTVVKGIGRVSVAPASPTDPIFVGDNDPRVPTTLERGRIPSVDAAAAIVGSIGTPSDTNRFITEQGVNTADIDQSQLTQDTLTAVGEANATTRRNRIVQSFVAGVARLRGVDLYKSADTGTFTGTVKVAIQADAAGAPSGTDLTSLTISNAAWLALTVGAIGITLDEIGLTVGGTYWIVVTPSTSDNSNHPNLGINSAGGYASGVLKYHNTTDGYVTASGDLYFRTYAGRSGQAVGIPDTASLVPVSVLPVGIVDMDLTDVSLGGVGESIVYTKRLPAGFFTPNSGFRLKNQFTFNPGGTGDFTLRIKLNGVTVASYGGFAGTGTHGIMTETLFLNNNSMTAQKIMQFMIQGLIAAVTAGTYSDSTTAIDTTQPMVLTVTVAFSSSNGPPSVTYPGTLLERIGL